MSGGAFDYKQWHISNIADDGKESFLKRLKEELGELEK